MLYAIAKLTGYSIEYILSEMPYSLCLKFLMGSIIENGGTCWLIEKDVTQEKDELFDLLNKPVILEE